MENDPSHKMFMTFHGIIMKIPQLLSEKGAKKGAEGAKSNAANLSNEEREVHHFIVKKMAGAKAPITVEQIAGDMGMPDDRVIEIVNKLENLKTFIYRSDGNGIDWAYPISLENTDFRMTASSGEQFFAA